MATNVHADLAAERIFDGITILLEDVPGSTINVQRPAQGYTIISLQPGDGSDWEEIMVDTRGEEPRVTRRTITRN